MFFSGHPIINDSVKFGMNKNGTKTGHAICLFANAEAANLAMEQKQGQNIGHRWIELRLYKYD